MQSQDFDKIWKDIENNEVKKRKMTTDSFLIWSPKNDDEINIEISDNWNSSQYKDESDLKIVLGSQIEDVEDVSIYDTPFGKQSTRNFKFPKASYESGL